MITFWFWIVVLAWVLFFVLEGFDFGVGVLDPLLGRSEHERGAIVRTIGPFWDGNEVWLVAAIGVTFAAFPAWYSALLSALYLPMAALLLLLAVRGVALEFRGKVDTSSWRRRCDLFLAGSSAAIVMLWGALLTVFVQGVALGPDGSVRGAGLSRSLNPLLSWPAVLGAAAALFAALLLGATFLGLRTSGPVRRRAGSLARLLGAAGATALLVAGIATASRLVLVAAALSLAAGMLARHGREALAFTTAAIGVAGTVVAILTANDHVVLQSTLNDSWSLTLSAAAATPQSLRLLTEFGVIVLPGVLAYQAYSYFIFRRRVASDRVPS